MIHCYDPLWNRVKQIPLPQKFCWFELYDTFTYVIHICFSESSSEVFTDYQINVKTSNRFGAGTDANIYIQLCGEKGYSEPMLLKNSQNVNKFERNLFDQFTFREELNRGELKSIKVWHDNSGKLIVLVSYSNILQLLCKILVMSVIRQRRYCTVFIWFCLKGIWPLQSS